MDTATSDRQNQRQRGAVMDVLRGEFAGDPRAAELFGRFLDTKCYSRPFVRHLIDVARGRQSDSWAVRRLAARMLQEHLLGLAAENTSEFAYVFQQLGLKRRRSKRLRKSVLKEGYSTRKLPGFIRQFRRRLKRPRCTVRTRSRQDVTIDDVRQFVRQSRQDCKLMLGRYLFSPEEVVERIRGQLEIGTGLPVAMDDPLWQRETQQAIAELPDYEAAILSRLQADTSVFWVTGETSSERNALVEYPVGTVVLVVKPPGSHHEFELKRAGRRGNHPLSARCHVPPSHRLDGGGMLSALQYEASQAASFGYLYRHVHGEAAPFSRIVRLLSKFDVPQDGRPLLEFLTDPAAYGEGYDEMRQAMATAVNCFREERGDLVPSFPGDLGLTAQFIAFASPAQAIISGSSSWRLDLLANYLSPDGPAAYFTRGLQVDFGKQDAKRFADDLLDEVLGVYAPPQVEYRDHQQYIDAALAVPGNRSKANKNYLNLVTQMGTVWGTLLAARGFSSGESFVARNVGLRSIWSQGKWRVRLVFHDHDNLVLARWNQDSYWAQAALPATRLDAAYIGGSTDCNNPDAALFCLPRIYRVEEPLAKKGQKRLRKALQGAYAKTLRAIESNPQVQTQFDKRFVARLRDWDSIVRKYVASKGSSNGRPWKSRVKKYLKKHGYSDSLIADHCGALEKHGTFVEKYAFLFKGKSDKA